MGRGTLVARQAAAARDSETHSRAQLFRHLRNEARHLIRQTQQTTVGNGRGYTASKLNEAAERFRGAVNLVASITTGLPVTECNVDGTTIQQVYREAKFVAGQPIYRDKF